jgi:hypothetical protein
MSTPTRTTEALLARLAGDAVLRALCPHGVYLDEAPANATRFVIVSFVVGFDEPMFGGRGLEDVLYLVKSVMTTSDTSAAAATRIQALLHHQPLAVVGAAMTVMRRRDRVRETEVDAVDPSMRWYHRGGRYQVVTSLP